MTDHPRDRFAERHLRHNLLALGADLAFFFVGLSFASQATVLPAFAQYLGAPNVLIGAIPAVLTVGWFLPSLFTAGHTEGLPRKLPFVLRYTVWERLPLLLLALVAFFLAETAPGLTLALLLVLLLVMSSMGGILMPAWMDIVGRAIPTTLRGRFFAMSNVVGTSLGLLGGLATAWILGAIAAPASYAICFLAGAACFGLSYGGLALTREPPADTPPPAVALGTYLRRIPVLLRRDPNFAWFLAARALTTGGTMAAGFYTVYALRRFGAPTWHVGVFTTVLRSGEIAGSLALGWLADRAGHRLVIVTGVAATIAANLVAVAAPSVELFAAVFALAGVQLAAVTISGLNAPLEFAPTVGERPTYLGLGNTSFAPAAFAAPLVAGLLADTLGFRAVFTVATLFGVSSLVVLLLRVREPRSAAQLADIGPPA
jgi:MFS family permease